MTVLAALLASAATLLWRPPGRWLVRRRLGLAKRPVHVPRWAVLLVPIGVLPGTVLAGVPPAHVGVVLTVTGVGVFGLRQWRAGRRRARHRLQRQEVSEAIGLMSAELRAGMLPQRVLGGLAADFDFLAPAAGAARLGGDVPAALRGAASDMGTDLLVDLAGAWLVAERAGAPLVGVLDQLGEAARLDLELAQEVEAGLAPARATGRLMAVLPVFALALGSGLGGNPLAVLTGTLPGILCLACGCALACAGVAWVERIAVVAEREA